LIHKILTILPTRYPRYWSNRILRGWWVTLEKLQWLIVLIGP